MTYAQCDANYPNLYFMVEGFWIQIPREEYLTVLDDDLTCRLQIQQIDTPFNILGMPFFMDYYISHDNDLGSMSFAPQKDSTKAPLQAGAVPTQKFKLAYIRENIENGEFLV